ncbi:MAG: hypothetical protein Harvfovirus27_21 [Harvfovirus sp.]|uniref:Uncharacterized protein n=1 Tax=Harvfovirus sp. TaxID=2487768 RepID=A0A3G5A2A2_9VIRU|nr:MAG: hypothetical protein Harvfovirus27_21 [Harvfovirus sp.]
MTDLQNAFDDLDNIRFTLAWLGRQDKADFFDEKLPIVIIKEEDRISHGFIHDGQNILFLTHRGFTDKHSETLFAASYYYSPETYWQSLKSTNLLIPKKWSLSDESRHIRGEILRFNENDQTPRRTIRDICAEVDSEFVLQWPELKPDLNGSVIGTVERKKVPMAEYLAKCEEVEAKLIKTLKEMLLKIVREQRPNFPVVLVNILGSYFA